MFILRKRFFRFDSPEEDRRFLAATRKKRLYMGVLRSISLFLIFVALAGPFSFRETTIEGNPKLILLIDNSSSMRVMDTSFLPSFVSALKDNVPTTLRYFGSGEESPTGDALLKSLEEGASILLVTDGRANKGRDLSSVIHFASSLNASVNAVNLSPAFDDVYVEIEGPEEVIAGTDASYTVRVRGIGNTGYKLTVVYDGVTLYSREHSGDFSFNFLKRITEGYHKIEAVAEANDFFLRNNKRYRVVEGKPKPRLLFVGRTGGPLHELLKKLYIVENSDISGLASGKYDAAIFNNVEAGEFDSKIGLLESFLDKENGALFVGGKNSFDRGGYDKHPVTSILPVSVGAGEEKPDERINVVILIDISQSTGRYFSRVSGQKKVDVEKALAASIISSLDSKDYVGVVAFNTQGFVVSPLSPLDNKLALTAKVATLKNGGGTVILSGMQEAFKMLSGAKGSKNIIVISDGVTLSAQRTLDFANQIYEKEGIKTYAVGVGRGTNAGFLRALAGAGGTNTYIQPEETEKLKILIGEPPEEDKPKTSFALEVTDPYHFVTSGLKLSSSISGFNYVLPKSASQVLVSTEQNNPLLVVWHFSLGRVGVLATDDGSSWAGSIYSGNDSLLISRLVNWVAGDVSRSSELSLKTKSVVSGKENRVYVYSSSYPKQEGLVFARVGNNLYKTIVLPKNEGFIDILGMPSASNYPPEFMHLGMDENFIEAVSSSGGRIYTPNDAKEIAEAVRYRVRRKSIEKKPLSHIFLIFAIIVFLAEIALRKQVFAASSR